MVVLLPAGVILIAYAASLAWLLRREGASALVTLAALCCLSLALRLADAKDFPAGLNDDEAMVVACSSSPRYASQLFGEGCTMMPLLLNALFQAPLVPVVGPNRWAIRSYSLLASILAVPAGFAVARALGLEVTASLATAAFLVVLPWSIFYGRISIGGELVFHELLLLAALAALVFSSGDWAEVVIGGFALTLLLYDYFCGRAMLGMPLVAAVLARGRRRVLCLGVLALALLGWLPHLTSGHAPHVLGLGTNPGYLQRPLQTLVARTAATLSALVHPVAMDAWLTIRSAGMHPWLIVVLALAGSLTGVRRGLFLWAGFLGGLAPAIVSAGDRPSVHRMLMALPFIALAAGAALEIVRPRSLRRAVTLAVVVTVGVQSVWLYFSPAFWPAQSRATFDADKTALGEALPLPPHPPLIATEQLEPFLRLHSLVDSRTQLLRVENWFPPNGASIYAFSAVAAPLLPFYEQLFGPDRVRVFGRAFLVRLEARDWSWLRQHGWAYEARCDGRRWQAQVPTLVHLYLAFRDLHCSQEVTQTWCGRWLGPSAKLRLEYSGSAVIATPTGRIVGKTGPTRSADFRVSRDDDLTITVESVPGGNLNVLLRELDPAGLRVPAWDRVAPCAPEAEG